MAPTSVKVGAMIIIGYLFFSKSLISERSFSSADGFGAAGAGSSSFFLINLFMALTIMKIQPAIIRKSITF